MHEFVNLTAAIQNNDYERMVLLCEEKPNRMRHPELIPALHLLCREASDSDFFKVAWTYFISKGFNPFELTNKSLNPLEYLIFKNPAFYDHQRFPKLPMEEAFWWLYYNFYNDPKYLLPDDRENHLIHFAYKYSTVLPNYYEKIQEPAIALFKYLPKESWFDYVPSPMIYQIYHEMFKSHNISEITQLLTGSRAPSLKKFVEENWKNYNFELLGYIRNICALNLKHEEKLEVLNFYAQNGPNEAFSQYVPKISPYESLLRDMSFRRFFKLFIENAYQNSDTIEMVEKLRRYNLALDFRDFETGRELHDYCSRELNRHEHALWVERMAEAARHRDQRIEYSSKNFSKHQQIIKTLQGKKLNSYELHVPQDVLEVYSWGRILKICIGSTHYIEKVATDELKMIFIKKDGKEYGCCTVASGTFGIIEIKGPCNSLIDPEARQLIIREVIALKNELEKIRPEDIVSNQNLT